MEHSTELFFMFNRNIFQLTKIYNVKTLCRSLALAILPGCILYFSNLLFTSQKNKMPNT